MELKAIQSVIDHLQRQPQESWRNTLPNLCWSLTILTLILGRYALLFCVTINPKSIEYLGSLPELDYEDQIHNLPEVFWIASSLVFGLAIGFIEFATFTNDWYMRQKTHGSLNGKRLVLRKRRWYYFAYIGSSVFYTMSACFGLKFFPNAARFVWATISLTSVSFLTAVILNFYHVRSQCQTYKPFNCFERPVARSEFPELGCLQGPFHELHLAQQSIPLDILEISDGDTVHVGLEVAEDHLSQNRDMGGAQNVEESSEFTQDLSPVEQSASRSFVEWQEAFQQHLGEQSITSMAGEDAGVEKLRATLLEHEFNVIIPSRLARTTILTFYRIIIPLSFARLIFWMILLVKRGKAGYALYRSFAL